jgi:hypothetical protein
MSSLSKPSTPVLQRRYPEHEYQSRIPVSLSPIPFRRANSMRLRTSSFQHQTSTLNELNLRQHNRSDRATQLLKQNLQRTRRGSLNMDTKSDANCVDSGGTDELNHNGASFKHMNGDVRRNNSNLVKNDRGMVSCEQYCWIFAKWCFDSINFNMC